MGELGEIEKTEKNSYFLLQNNNPGFLLPKLFLNSENLVIGSVWFFYLHKKFRSLGLDSSKRLRLDLLDRLNPLWSALQFEKSSREKY